MSVVDDYGRYFAHPSLLRAACYPLQLDRVSEADVKQMLSECLAVDLLTLYNSGKHLQIHNFRQQTRAPSKFPEPSANDSLSNCKAVDKQMRSESESESESKTGAQPVSPSTQRISDEKNLERIEAEIKRITGSVDSHIDLDPEDRAKRKRLREQAEILKKKLNFAV